MTEPIITFHCNTDMFRYFYQFQLSLFTFCTARRHLIAAMTSILDSEAHFQKRCDEVGLSDRGRQATLVAGYSTLGRLAFGVGQPGMPVPELEFTRFATNTCWAQWLQCKT